MSFVTFQTTEEFQQSREKILKNSKMSARIYEITEATEVVVYGNKPPAFFTKHLANTGLQNRKKDEAVLRLRKKLLNNKNYIQDK